MYSFDTNCNLIQNGVGAGVMQVLAPSKLRDIEESVFMSVSCAPIINAI